MVSAEDLAKLPPRAIVAFAVRCARRVWPLYVTRGGGFDHVVVAKAEKSLAWAEALADGGGADAGELGPVSVHEIEDAANGAAAFTAGRALINAVTVALAAVSDRSPGGQFNADSVVHFARETASMAILAAGNAVTAIALRMEEDGVTSMAGAAEAAQTAVAEAQWTDYQKILGLRLGADDPVDPTPSGPLGPYWPNGEPGWLRVAVNDTNVGVTVSGRAEAEVVKAPPAVNAAPVVVYLDSAEFSDDEMADVLGKFSDLYHAISGDVLVIERTETLDPSRVLVPEGVE